MIDKSSSHKQILKATGIVGGAQVITILIRIVRSKIIAVLLGPTGVGILGLYQSMLDLIRSATGFGIQYSAVRDIAEASGTNDQSHISRTVLILRRWVWFTGLLGLVLMAVCCKPISRYTFGDDRYRGFPGGQYCIPRLRERRNNPWAGHLTTPMG